MTSSDETSAQRTERWRRQEEVFGRSPIHATLGLSLAINGSGDVRVRYDGLPGASNNLGVVSGGALTAMIDSAVMQSVLSTASPFEHVITIELKVNFLRAAPRDGGPLIATATVHHRGRRTAVGSAQVSDEQGKTIAVGLVTAAVTVRETVNFVRDAGPASPSTSTRSES